MKDLRYGNLTNPKFIDSIMATGSYHKPVQIRVKRPGNEGQQKIWEYLDTILRRNNFPNSLADTLDAREQQFFRMPPEFLATIEPLKNEVKLYLAKGEAEQINDYGPNILKVFLLTEKHLHIIVRN